MKRYIKADYDYKSMEEIILSILEKDEYGFYGLRVDYNNYSVGDVCEPSHQWWQDDPGDDRIPYNEELGLWDDGELDGTCAIRILTQYDGNSDRVIKSIQSAIKSACEVYAKMYGDDYNILLLGSYSASSGNDIDEVIMRDAVVLYKF